MKSILIANPILTKTDNFWSNYRINHASKNISELLVPMSDNWNVESH